MQKLYIVLSTSGPSTALHHVFSSLDRALNYIKTFDIPEYNKNPCHFIVYETYANDCIKKIVFKGFANNIPS